MSDTEYTGAKTTYYEVLVTAPTRAGRATYVAECNDIIEALGMTFAEGEAFKALWRRAASRLRPTKTGYDNGLYDAQKVHFYSSRMLVQMEAYGPANHQISQFPTQVVEQAEAFEEQLRERAQNPELEDEYSALLALIREVRAR